jgi:AcrR family transcriptional regulator
MNATREKGPLGRFFARNRILHAAARVFAKNGARGVTVEDLLQEAGVSRRTFYKFFRNQDEVLLALYEVSCDLLANAFRHAFASTSKPREKLERMVDAYLAFNRTSGALLRVLEGEALRSGSPLATRRAELLEAAAQELAQAGADHPVDPLMAYGVLVAMEAVSYRMHAEGRVTEEQLARARAVMLGLLSATLAAPRRARQRKPR